MGGKRFPGCTRPLDWLPPLVIYPALWLAKTGKTVVRFRGYFVSSSIGGTAYNKNWNFGSCILFFECGRISEAREWFISIPKVHINSYWSNQDYNNQLVVLSHCFNSDGLTSTKGWMDFSHSVITFSFALTRHCTPFGIDHKYGDRNPKLQYIYVPICIVLSLNVQRSESYAQDAEERMTRCTQIFRIESTRRLVVNLNCFNGYIWESHSLNSPVYEKESTAESSRI